MKPSSLSVLPENIPPELKALDRWLLWKWEQRKGRWAKTPRQTDGHYASTSDRHTWCNFDTARQAMLIGDFDGLGVVLPDGLVGVDLDDCIGSEGLTEEAKLIMAMLPTYAEISPSGKGIKLLAAGHLAPGLVKTCHARGIEMYDGEQTNRYFALTGRVCDDQHKAITGQRDGLYALQTLITEPLDELRSKFEAPPDRETIQKAQTCLENLAPHRADDYGTWTQVGMALRWADPSDEMLARWISWSEQSAKYLGDEECRLKWESFKREDGRLVTVAYLEKMARKDGYDPDKFRTGCITGAELCAKKIVRDYLIDDMMVRNEPFVLGGAAKSLKTTVALDMAVSLATGTPFLGQFAVSGAQNTMFLSGESGEATLQENMRNICDQRGCPHSRLDRLKIGFRLPKLDSMKCVDDLVEELQESEIDVIFIDPLYRSLRVGDKASNIFSMGEQLELIAEQIHRAGITVILLHHFRKQGPSYDTPPGLEDLSQSGLGEFGRQFLLLKQRKKYLWNGDHTLYFQWGGSAGHQGARILEAFIGTRKTGLTWQTTLRTEEEWEARQKETRDLENADKREQIAGEVVAKIREEPGINVTKLRDDFKISRPELKILLGELLALEMIIEQDGKRGAKCYFVSEMDVAKTKMGATCEGNGSNENQPLLFG